jgi:hypothetical protein
MLNEPPLSSIEDHVDQESDSRQITPSSQEASPPF